ncbi:unnamed protein product [Didymodactylos carnosus]|uniref:Uncharacterized protein n=1 Tax=Didymodactylos carnosus TaxID=1234261 RepID=A0A8S2ESC5_9BILA|nr:unnamed protein product [Didymodactylos carnosus]CAF4034266.1 unnamed protein product [Didymodactylos carnosus]
MTAVNMIEDILENDNLVVYFSHHCIRDLRIANIFDKKHSLTHVHKIRNFFHHLLPKLTFGVKELVDEWSSFTFDKKSNDPSNDTVNLSDCLINGIMEHEDNVQHISVSRRYTNRTSANGTYTNVIKLFHEITDAANFEQGRLYLPAEKDIDVKFETPATHTLTSESGKAVERFLCGCVIDAIYHPVTYSDKKLLIIDTVYFLESIPSREITDESINELFAPDLKTIIDLKPKAGGVVRRNKKRKSNVKRYKKRESASNLPMVMVVLPAAVIMKMIVIVFR